MSFDYDVNKLYDAYTKAKENTKENLYGTFRVKVEKIEYGETGEQSKQPGMPKGTIQFRILEGEHKNKCLFYNQMLVCIDKNNELNAFGIKLFDDFLNSLKPTFEVAFSDCPDAFKANKPGNYQNLLLDVAEDIAAVTYDLEVTKKTVKGQDYPQYKIVKVYE